MVKQGIIRALILHGVSTGNILILKCLIKDIFYENYINVKITHKQGYE